MVDLAGFSRGLNQGLGTMAAFSNIEAARWGRKHREEDRARRIAAEDAAAARNREQMAWARQDRAYAAKARGWEEDDRFEVKARQFYADLAGMPHDMQLRALNANPEYVDYGLKRGLNMDLGKGRVAVGVEARNTPQGPAVTPVVANENTGSTGPMTVNATSQADDTVAAMPMDDFQRAIRVLGGVPPPEPPKPLHLKDKDIVVQNGRVTASNRALEWDPVTNQLTDTLTGKVIPPSRALVRKQAINYFEEVFNPATTDMMTVDNAELSRMKSGTAHIVFDLWKKGYNPNDTMALAATLMRASQDDSHFGRIRKGDLSPNALKESLAGAVQEALEYVSPPVPQTSGAPAAPVPPPGGADGAPRDPTPGRDMTFEQIQSDPGAAPARAPSDRVDMPARPTPPMMYSPGQAPAPAAPGNVAPPPASPVPPPGTAPMNDTMDLRYESMTDRNRRVLDERPAMPGMAPAGPMPPGVKSIRDVAPPDPKFGLRDVAPVQDVPPPDPRFGLRDVAPVQDVPPPDPKFGFRDPESEKIANEVMEVIERTDAENIARKTMEALETFMTSQVAEDMYLARAKELDMDVKRPKYRVGIRKIGERVFDRVYRRYGRGGYGIQGKELSRVVTIAMKQGIREADRVAGLLSAAKDMETNRIAVEERKLRDLEARMNVSGGLGNM